MLLGAAACAGGATGEGGDQPADGGPVTVDVGILGIAADAPLWLGIEKGYFRDEGIKVRPRVSGAGGAAFVPSLLDGELDVGAGGADGAIQAIGKGLDIKILAKDGAPVSHGHTAASIDDTDHITLAVVAGQDSDVKNLQDLEGRTLSAITVTGLQYLCIQRAMEKAGADRKAAEVLEMPLPEMLPALEAKEVDAAAVLEPFLTQAKHSGARVVSYACEEAMPGVIQGAYFVSGQWAQENPDVVEGLSNALVRANRYAQQHPEEQRRVIAENTEIPPDVVEQMALYPFPSGDERPRKNTLGGISELMVRYGLLDKKPDLSGSLTG